jgi:hypothetical protein
MRPLYFFKAEPSVNGWFPAKIVRISRPSEPNAGVTWNGKRRLALGGLVRTRPALLLQKSIKAAWLLGKD